MNIDWGIYDYLLLALVAAQSTLIAYLAQPKLKAVVYSMPIPFTVAFLAVGRRVDASNVCGLMLLLAFTHAVRILHLNLKVHIVSSIVIAAIGYCLIGAAALPLVPTSDTAFWIAVVTASTLALLLLFRPSALDEPHHRTHLPLWLKMPIVLAVVTAVLLIKTMLQGFMTVFPLVGVVASYEARYCLLTIVRQVPVLILGLITMMIVLRFAAPAAGLYWALALGWLSFMAVFVPLHLRRHR